MATRTQNEQRFSNWQDLPGGGRRYWVDVRGRARCFARYIKVVDVSETTLLFVQEIYNYQGRLLEIHQKYPVDLGHRPA